jgi:hypothetical protein
MIVPTLRQQNVGLKLKAMWHVHLCKMKDIMTKSVVNSGIVFGLCVTIVALCSGCATHPAPHRVPMATVDLNYFQTDCRFKTQQVAMLQSMRLTADEQFAARMRLSFQPWTIVTNGQVWLVNYDMALGNPNRYINYHLNQLRYCS